MRSDNSAVNGVLITGDLIFSTKITSTARALGLDVRVVGTPEAAMERIQPGQTRCVVLDLALSSLTEQRIREIVGAAGGASVIAYGSHVDTERLQAARDSGCTEVMPRSRLSGELPQLLAKYLSVMPDE